MASYTKNSFLIKKRVILVRMGGELGIKSRQTRQRMMRHLRHNIKALLNQYSVFKILDFRDRLLIYSESNTDLDEIAHAIATSVSGVSSVSLALVVKATENSIISGGLSEALATIQPHSSFAVRVRREGNHPFSSMDIARKLGAAILSSRLKGIRVDLESPDFEISLDIRGPLAFTFLSTLRGIDGIPTQSQGAAIALIRPHSNSIFTALLMKKRGVKVIPIFFKTGKLAEEEYLDDVKAKFGETLSIVSIEAFLDSFQSLSSLCMICQVFCEHTCQKIAKTQQISTILSPTCFNYNNETMSLEALKIIEKSAALSIIRPIQLGFFNNQSVRNKLDENGSCCNFRSKVSIQLFDDFNSIDLKKVLSFKPKIEN